MVIAAHSQGHFQSFLGINKTLKVAQFVLSDGSIGCKVNLDRGLRATLVASLPKHSADPQALNSMFASELLHLHSLMTLQLPEDPSEGACFVWPLPSLQEGVLLSEGNCAVA
mgnify:CR=1 FL=1